MTAKPGQPGYTGEPEDPKTLAPKMVGQTQDDQADNAAKGSGKKAVAEEDLSAKAARLERELAEVRAQSAGDTVRLKVEGPHSALVHNGVYVGNEWTEVPAHAAPAIMEGAADSGVSIVQEEV